MMIVTPSESSADCAQTARRMAVAWLFILLSVVLGVGCGGADGTTAPPVDKTPTASAIAKVAGDLQQAVVSTALTEAISVKVTSSAGVAVPNVAVQFSVTSGGGSVSPSSSTTNSQGVATASWTLGDAVGSQQVTASAEGVSSSVVFQGTATPIPVATVSTDVSAVTLLPGITRKIEATAKSAAGNVLTGRVATWVSSNVGVATVDASGMLTAVGVGSAVITVTIEGKPATVAVTVSPVPAASVTLSVAMTTLLPGNTLQINAATRDSAGGSLTGRTVAWTTSNAAAATVSGSGVVSAVAPGTATITASVEGKSATAAITVIPVPVSSVSITPATTTVQVGRTQQLTAVTKDSAGGTLTGRSVTWTSSNTAVASVSNTTGMVAALAVGSATITASSEGKSSTAAIVVMAASVPATVVASVPSYTIVEGATTEFARAVVRDQRGDTMSAVVVWTSASSGVASIDASGRITPIAPGTTELIATVGGLQSRVNVTVEPRSIYGECTLCHWSQSDPRYPVFNAANGGQRPNASDTRQQIIIDENFTVPIGTEVVWDNKIVWVRPTSRKNINVFGRLTVHNSLLLWDQTQDQQTRLAIQSGGVLNISNSIAMSANLYWTDFSYEDGSTIILDRFQGTPWTSIHGRVSYTATNASTVHVTFFTEMNNSQISISDSHHVWIELMLPTGTHTMAFPARLQWQNWNLSGIWPGSPIQLTNSYVYDRDITLNNNVNVTINGAPGGLSLGWSISKLTPGFVDCELSGLGNPDDDNGVAITARTWSLPCTNSSLTVNNVTFRRLWTSIFGNVRLKVSDSNLVDPNVFGPSTMEIYRSSVDYVRLFLGGGAATGAVYLEDVKMRNAIQVNGAGSVVYGFNVTSRNATPFRVNEESGGRYMAVSTRGRPW